LMALPSDTGLNCPQTMNASLLSIYQLLLWSLGNVLEFLVTETVCPFSQFKRIISYSSPDLHKIPARVHCTVQVCGLVWRTCTPHHTVAGRSSISLTQSPFPFPSTTAVAHPLSATCWAVPLHPYALAADHLSLSLRVRSPSPPP
jgi:hypothetical protein